MSYTLAYTGTQIDNILGRSAPNGEFDGYFADINDKLDKLNIVTTSDDYATVQAYVQNNVAVALSDGGGLYAYAGEYDGNYYFAKLTQGSSDTTDAVYEVAYIDSSNNWYVGGGSALAPIYSPNFTGDPTAPTAPQSSNDTSIATTAFVHSAVDPVSSAALNAYPTDTASGDIVSISDGADGIPVKAFTGSIIPSQNLNGQSAPYPAGGGVNKYSGPSTVNKGTTQYESVTIDPLPPAVYTISAKVSTTAAGATRCRIALREADGTAITAVTIPVGTTRTSVTVDTTSYGKSVGRLYFYSTQDTSDTNTAVFADIQIETGSSASDYAPYSNVCPISGWSGAEIYRTGVNVWDEQWENGYYDSGTPASGAGIRSKAANYIAVKPNTTYYCKCGVSANIAMSYYDAAQNYISNYVVAGGTGAFTTPTGCYYIRFHVASSYGATYNNNISINYPATETAYHASEQAQTILLSFGQTVYAGTLTALGGDLWKIQPTHEKLEVPKTGWAYANGVFYLNNVLPSGYTKLSDATWLCNTFAPAVAAWDTTTAGNQWANNSIGNQNSASYYRRLMVKSTVYGTDADAFMAGLPSEFYILYPLATLPDPITITGEDLQTLLGANTVWTDVGSVTGMTYRADTALYIDKKLGA